MSPFEKKSATAFNQVFWKENWDVRLEAYWRVAPRFGIYLEHLFKNTVQSCLEIACGSARDSVYLAQKGKRAIAIDYEDTIIAKLRGHFRDIPNITFRNEDAFSLTMKAKSVDLSFHNGFFILFPEDDKIFRLLKEQERVTRRTIVFAVHNEINTALRAEFRRLARTDPLYDVRFFRPEEMLSLVEKSGISYHRIRLAKFGGLADVFYQRKIRRWPNPFFRMSPHLVPALYRYHPWTRTERIAVIIQLEA